MECGAECWAGWMEGRLNGAQAEWCTGLMEGRQNDWKAGL